MKLLRALFFLTVPVIFLVLGFRAGLLTSSSTDPGMASVQSASNRQTVSSGKDKQQLNLLYLTVSDRSEHGSLQSAWLVSYHVSNQDTVNFVPLFPLEKAGAGEMNEIIQKNFSISANGELAPLFIETLQGMYLLTWDAYLILEPQEIDQAIALIGDPQEANLRIANAQLALKMDQAPLESRSENERAAMIQQICAELVTTAESDQLETFADYIIAHMVIPSRESGLSPAILRYLITNPRLSCIFPTLQ